MSSAPFPSGRISVVIPAYNASAYLREALESALGQTVALIVVDDGSTDDSAEIAASFGVPVRVIRQKSSGEAAARNRGIEDARGHWLAFLDADDVWEPNKLALQSACIARHHPVACHTN
jgi:glycosyltransferase involved in cell wall biosynthesis